MWQEPLARPSQSAKVPSIGLFVHQHLLIKRYLRMGTVTSPLFPITFVKCMVLLSSSAKVGPLLYASVSQTSSNNPKVLGKAHSWATLAGILTWSALGRARSLHFLEGGF